MAPEPGFAPERTVSETVMLLLHHSGIKLVPAVGVEPTMSRSSSLLQSAGFAGSHYAGIEFGGLGRNRTLSPRFGDEWFTVNRLAHW